MTRDRSARKPTRPTARRTGPARRGRPAPSVSSVERGAPARGLTVLAEAPRAHLVCRVCGRIANVPLETNDALVLERMAEHRPEGWSVELIAFSLTGACARCREGPRAVG